LGSILETHRDLRWLGPSTPNIWFDYFQLYTTHSPLSGLASRTDSIGLQGPTQNVAAEKTDLSEHEVEPKRQGTSVDVTEAGWRSNFWSVRLTGEAIKRFSVLAAQNCHSMNNPAPEWTEWTV
jgi:hypothetical protein